MKCVLGLGVVSMAPGGFCLLHVQKVSVSVRREWPGLSVHLVNQSADAKVQSTFDSEGQVIRQGVPATNLVQKKNVTSSIDMVYLVI